MKAVLSLRPALRWLRYAALLLPAILFQAAAPNASAAVIDVDTFANPSPAEVFVVFPSTSKTIIHAVTGVLGGEREALFQVNGAVVPQSATGVIGTQSGLAALQLQTQNVAPTVATLTYNGIGNVGLGGFDLTSGNENNRFEFRFAGSDALPTAGLGFVVTVTSNSGSSTASATAINSQDPFIITVPFSNFSGSANFSAVNSIVVQFNGVNQTTDIDFEITGIHAVPEPAGVVMMALGGAFACIQLARRGIRRSR
jgi:hypothetical protein